MTTNFDTNKIYLSKGLKESCYAVALQQLQTSIISSRIAWDYLPQTESVYHIWSRDYMPIQVRNNRFVRFRYTPDYLVDSPEYKPDTSAILDTMGLEVVNSGIVIDGGNVISCGDKVIMTDKVFRENPNYEHDKLVDKLSELLEAELVLIPEDSYDEYGHADGMVRYMGDGHVLLNNYCDFDKSLRKKLLNALTPHFEITELHYGGYSKDSWAYINFLHVGNHIFIPILKNNLSDKAFVQIREAFPRCECHPVWQYESVIREGGAINCSTWNIMVDHPEEYIQYVTPKQDCDYVQY